MKGRILILLCAAALCVHMAAGVPNIGGIKKPAAEGTLITS